MRSHIPLRCRNYCATILREEGKTPEKKSRTNMRLKRAAGPLKRSVWSVLATDSRCDDATMVVCTSATITFYASLLAFFLFFFEKIILQKR